MNSVVDRNLFYGAAALLLAALLLGGGGGGAPLHNMIIELISIMALVLTFWHPRTSASSREERLATTLLILIVATPLLQLIPLPFAIWSSLPGRDFVVQVDELIGNVGSSRPISLDPEATWLSAAALLPAAAMFLAAARLDPAHRKKLITLVIGAAMASMVLGAFQLASGGSFQIYNTSHRNFATGLFANRNHQADLLLVAMLLASALIWDHKSVSQGSRWGIWFAMILALSAGVIATTSRMGFLLLPLALVGSLTFVPLARLWRRKTAALIGAGAVLLAMILVGLSEGTRRVIERFDTLSDARFEFWADALVAAQKYFPWGSGLGTFATVYQAIEDLNKVTPVYVNHAHNEYVQVVVEAGLWGCAVILLFFGVFVWLSIQRGLRDAMPRAACFSIGLILLHSVVDYPLRMLSMLALFGLLCALLLPTRQVPELSTTNQ